MRNRRLFAAYAPVLVAALLSASACATKGDLRNVTTEIRALSMRQDSLLVALQRQALVTQDSLRGTTNQLLEVRGTVNQQLARIQQEIQMMRQENAQFAQLLASIRDQLERIQRMASGPAPVQSVEPPTGGSSSAAIEVFQAGKEAFDLRQYGTARRAFNQVIEQYPNDMELAPQAMFKIAEILLLENKPNEAIDAFDRVRQIYPGSTKTPDAVLQIGLIHVSQGRNREARIALQRVIDSYPGTEAAMTASQRIREIPPGQ
jgi:tol-pal system protein YbgF